MGNYHMTIKNETQDYYSYCFHYHPEHTEGIRCHRVLGPYERHENGQREIMTTVYVRYGRESKWACRNNPMLQIYYNGIYNYDFYIRPRGDMIQLCSSKGGEEPWCTNHGEIARRQQRQERERRRREERERQRQAEQRRRREEQERQNRAEEERRRIQRERQRQEEERQRRERERRRREEEERRRKERERRKREEERRRREEERRRREEEERRRRERIERERRIQAQISKEADALKNKLGRAAEKRRLNTSLTGREQQHQRSHVLAQTVEDDAAAITYEEESIVADRFQNLLDIFKVQIKDPNDSRRRANLTERIRMLYDQLISNYCAEVDLQIWFHSSFDEATKIDECSLTDKLDIVEALLKVVINDENKDLVQDMRKEVVVHEKHALMIRLMASLKEQNRPLSCHLLVSCLDAFAGLLPVNKEYIESIVFNKLWTPLEAIILLMRASDISQDDLTLFLHTIRTYRICISESTIALKSSDRISALQACIDNEGDKPLIAVINEMRLNGVPGNILDKVQEIVEYVVTAFPSCEGLDISDQIENGIQALKESEFDEMEVPKFGQILLGLSIVVKEEMHYFPRVTQLVSLVTLLLCKKSDLNGCLLEISTGEGKSCLVAMLAVILAQKGNKVDIVTSSPLLAMRDAEEWSGYFEKFGLTAKAAFPIGLSKCKTPDEMDKVIASAYRSNIVYGTVGNFAADTLRQEFEKKNIRGSRGFDAVIVDEVDYMTLDNGVQVTFLSHASSGMRHVEQVLASIWSMVCGCRPIEEKDSGEMFWFTPVQHFHKATVSALVGNATNENFNALELLRPALDFGYIKKGDFSNLMLYENQIAEGKESENTREYSQNQLDKIMSGIDVPEQRDILTVLEKTLDDVSFECYKTKSGMAELFGAKGTTAGKIRMLLLENGLACELLTEDEMVESIERAMGEKIKYSHEYAMPTKETQDGDGILYIPEFLEPYVQNRLKIFIKNALRAIIMTKGREYTVDRSSAESSSASNAHHFDCVIPVDFKASGVLEKNKRWGDGLQQFLEMKHQLALTPLSTVTNYLSNFHYFKRYADGSGVYGVSGTLGEESDCSFLAKHFKVSCYPIPTHKNKKLVEMPMLQVDGGEDSWIESISKRTKIAISPKKWCKGQAALVVCEDLKTASKLQQALQKVVSSPDKITMYTRSDKHTVEGIDFGPGHIIIATNLGGRGTDFAVTDEVNDSGGLFVLLTHFPSNRRVEKQIFGRTARKGRPGATQMVLNYQHLARAYQGQNIDVMRKLREDYERERIIAMETDELLTIDIREKLFGMFCERLSALTSLYEGAEKGDWGSMMVCEVPSLLEKLGKSQKMDCKPAQNAYKETWAQWLILNEHRIEDNENVDKLMSELGEALDKRQDEVTQGKSANFYDHIRQAIGRMYLHEMDHSKDCGTLAAWDLALQVDKSYGAIALYNKAYIVINMRKDGYLEQAISLLKEVVSHIDVHVAENANTMMACHISSANGKFEPHNNGETNFNRQLEVRNSFFKMWLDYTAKAIEKLQKLKDDGEDAITEEKGIFALIEKPSHLEANELQELFNEGLQVVYEVKKKPRFCIDALICAIIGVLQVFAGALVCVCTFGSATQIGLGLITEGVSDIYAGIQGMIQGTFDWGEWAISKAISIGLSLISAGFSKIKDATCAVAKGVKGLLTGTKTLSSAWDDCVKAGKTIWTSAKSSVTSTVGAMSKESFKQSIETLATNGSLKQIGKYVSQEVITQGVMKGLEVGISKGTEAMFEDLLSERFTSEIGKGLRGSPAMDSSLCQLIVCCGVPETSLQAENPGAYQIPSSNEAIIDRQIKDICERVVPELITDNAVVIELFSRLKEVKDEMEEILRAMDASGKLFTAITVAAEFGTYTAQFVTMFQNIPTQKVIQEKVVPEFQDDIEMLLRDGDVPKYKSDDRSNFATVLKLKEKLFQVLTSEVASAFTDACASHLNSFCTDFAKSKLQGSVTHALHKTTGRFETNYHFQKQREQYHNKEMQKDLERMPTKPVTEQEMSNLTLRVEKIEEADKPPSIVELKAIVAVGQLGGKGLAIQTVDRDGTELSSVTFMGSDNSQGAIKLRVVREDVQMEREKGFFAKMKETVLGKDNPWSGRFDLVCDDGQIKTLDSSEDNSLYYAVVMATQPSLTSEEVKDKATVLRMDIGEEMIRNPEKYIILNRRQQEYEAAYGESTFFSLPPKPGTTGNDANTEGELETTEGELDRGANIVDNSFTMTRMKMALEEKSTHFWKKLVSGDKAFLMSTLKGSISLIRNTTKPVGKETEAKPEKKDDKTMEPASSGDIKPEQDKLLYIPSKTILQDCEGRMNANFSQLSKHCSQEEFVSMVIPAECDDEILASETGLAYGIAEDKEKAYGVYKKLVEDCLCGTSEECNPKRLLKLIMICSHPDATLDILTDVGLVNTGFVESTDSETEETATSLEKTESEKSEGEDNTTDKEKTEVSESGGSEPTAESQDNGVEEEPAGMEQEDRAEGPWGLSGAGIDAYFKMCFLVVLAKYKVAGCIDEESYQELVTWVEQDGFLNDKGKEYLDIVNALEEAL